MKIGITGVTGFIGQKVASLAVQHGHEVVGFSRQPRAVLPNCREVRLFQTGAGSPPVDVSGLDAIIHLSGESVLGYWTAAKKKRIIDSRRETTHALVKAIATTPRKPAVFLSASGTGYYGDRGVQELDESAPNGKGFLAEVCWIWEDETAAVAKLGVRVCSLRTGMVLGKNRGAFPMLKTIFSFGIGGKLGSGHQYMPWLHIDDIASLYLYCLETESIRGPVNASAPDACTNTVFTHTLAGMLHRPAIFGVPSFAIKAALGELSFILLDSQRVVPTKAIRQRYTFTFPTLKSALQDLLK